MSMEHLVKKFRLFPSFLVFAIAEFLSVYTCQGQVGVAGYLEYVAVDAYNRDVHISGWSCANYGPLTHGLRIYPPGGPSYVVQSPIFPQFSDPGHYLVHYAARYERSDAAPYGCPSGSKAGFYIVARFPMASNQGLNQVKAAVYQGYRFARPSPGWDSSGRYVVYTNVISGWLKLPTSGGAALYGKGL